MSGGGNAGGARGAGNSFGMKMKGLLDGAGSPGWRFDGAGVRDAMGGFRDQMQNMRGDFRDMRGQMQQAQDLGPDIQQRLMQGLAPLRRAGFPFSR
jgi:hypothetical protein